MATRHQPNARPSPEAVHRLAQYPQRDVQLRCAPPIHEYLSPGSEPEQR